MDIQAGAQRIELTCSTGRGSEARLPPPARRRIPVNENPSLMGRLRPVHPCPDAATGDLPDRLCRYPDSMPGSGKDNRYDRLRPFDTTYTAPAFAHRIDNSSWSPGDVAAITWWCSTENPASEISRTMPSAGPGTSPPRRRPGKCSVMSRHNGPASPVTWLSAHRGDEECSPGCSTRRLLSGNFLRSSPVMRWKQ